MLLLAVAGCVQDTDGHTALTNDNGIPLSTLSYNPKAAAINAQLGVGYLQQGDIERAKTKLLMAQKQDPHSSIVAASMAYYYDKIGNAKEAEQYYKRAYSLATEKGDAANNYGVFLCKKKDYAAAYTYFQKAIDDPDYVSTAQTYENLGLCHLAQNDETAAKDYFLKALRIDPKLATSQLQMAEMSVKAKDWQGAENYLMQYTATGEQSPDALWLGIQTAQALGYEEKAMNLARQLKTLYPNSIQYHQYLTTRGVA
ncbi:MAG: pilF [Gammaproteobacteria bacterium]|jgi:type IV pilus assembly protein PilF|nr:pilF [Gammaproteobacteria bacterium]